MSTDMVVHFYIFIDTKKMKINEKLFITEIKR